MTTAEDFENYLQAKIVLNQLACQFYKNDISEYRARQLGICYTNDDIFNSLGNVACVFHRYTPEGLYIWNKLGITKPILLMRDMWEYRRKKAIKARDKDYRKEYLEIKLACLNMVEEYYKSETTIESTNKTNLKYNVDIDLSDGIIEGYYHNHESAGEAAWNLLGIEDDFISLSELDKIKNQLISEMLIKSKIIKSHDDIKENEYSSKTIDELNELKNRYLNNINELNQEVENTQSALNGEMLNYNTVQGFVEDISKAKRRLAYFEEEVEKIKEEINQRKVKILN